MFMTVEEECSGAVRKLARRVEDLVAGGEKFSDAFNREYHFSDFTEEVKISVRSGVKRFLRQWQMEAKRRENRRLAGARIEALRANEKIAPLH